MVLQPINASKTSTSYLSLARAILSNRFDYVLPSNRIAERPVNPRDNSKLLVVPTDQSYSTNNLIHSHFHNLSSYIPSNSLIIRNISRVIPARLFLRKQTGGKAQLLLLEPRNELESSNYQTQFALQKPIHGQTWYVLLGGRNIQQGDCLTTIDNQNVHFDVHVLQRDRQHALVKFNLNNSNINNHSLTDVLAQVGTVPLPPYIRRQSDTYDAKQYQTVFANVDGSVAAPTAALHFSTHLFETLAKKTIRTADVVLHVAAGTFQQVEVEQVSGHHMHQEHIAIDKAQLHSIIQQINISAPVVALGTTSVRTIESLYWFGVRLLLESSNWSDIHSLQVDQWEPYERLDQLGYDGLPSCKEALSAVYRWCGEDDVIFGQTKLLIVPGYPFQITDALITNFHQPRSTLLMLVSAFYGGQPQQLLQVYQNALDNNYRFLSYGDGSLYATSQILAG